MSFFKLLFGSIAALFTLMWVMGKFNSGEWAMPSLGSSSATTETAQPCDQQAVINDITTSTGSTIDSQAEIELARERFKEACGY